MGSPLPRTASDALVSFHLVGQALMKRKYSRTNEEIVHVLYFVDDTVRGREVKCFYCSNVFIGKIWIWMAVMKCLFVLYLRMPDGCASSVHGCHAEHVWSASAVHRLLSRAAETNAG